MKIIIYSIPLLFLFVLTACPSDAEQEDWIYVKNNSDHNISYFFEWGGGGTGKIYPDTILPLGKIPFTVPKRSEIRDTVPLLSYIYKTQQVDTLCFFILDTDTIEKYDWNTIREEYKILKRYDLSLQDFKHLKKIITFPPSEGMKDIKMYPPYGE